MYLGKKKETLYIVGKRKDIDSFFAHSMRTMIPFILLEGKTLETNKKAFLFGCPITKKEW